MSESESSNQSFVDDGNSTRLEPQPTDDEEVERAKRTMNKVRIVY